MNYSKLGYLQLAIIQLLKEEGQLERDVVYMEMRSKFYPFKAKCKSRVAIKLAIRSLKERGIITEKYGILGLKNNNLNLSYNGKENNCTKHRTMLNQDA